jgi:hypothetical protein
MVAGLLLLASVWGRRPPEVVRIGGELAGGYLTGGLCYGLVPALLRAVLDG